MNGIDKGAKWGPRLRGTRDALADAALVHEQTIRDAKADGLAVNAIAHELGIKNRNKITAVLRPDAEVPEPTQPALPVVVYLRARRHGEETWARVRQAMWARGWVTVADHTTAWHLARGGCTLVRVDFSAYDDGCIAVEMLRPVRGQPVEEVRHVPLKEMLPTMEGIRLERELPAAADWPVRLTFDEDVEWKVLAGGRYGRPTRWDDEAINNIGQKGAVVLDEQVVARLVANLLE